jgi:excisionase family DNA binding protein
MGAILTVQEVADRMRCEHRTVRRAIRSGELEAALIGGKWLVKEEAVDDWFRSRCASSNPFSPSPRRTPRAPAQGDPTAPLASKDCRRWRGEADERPKARQAV